MSYSPEWVMSALEAHLRHLGCKCPKPLIGYSPNFGPRCRLCNVDAEDASKALRTTNDALVAAYELASAEREALRDEKKRLAEALELALSALPDSINAGPDGTGYKFAWDELSGDEQEWVKSVRQRIRANRGIPQ